MAGGSIRRSMKRTVPVSISYIESLVNKIDLLEYGFSIKGGLTPEEQRMRNKAIVSLLYLSARRVREIVGRTYKGDVWPGIYLKDIREDMLPTGDMALIMNCRILKKGLSKAHVFNEVILDLEDEPFITHIKDWIEHQRSSGREKLIELSQSRVYNILKEIDPRIVGAHWFRHQRLSHLARTLDPYQLTEQIGFWEDVRPAITYVHGRVDDYLDAVKRVRDEAREVRK